MDTVLIEAVLQDCEEGRAWLIGAAEHGLALAAFTLGRVFREGVGVDPDPVQAHMWLNLAASVGYAVAGQQRDALADRMRPRLITCALQENGLMVTQDWTMWSGSEDPSGNTLNLSKMARESVPQALRRGTLGADDQSFQPVPKPLLWVPYGCPGPTPKYSRNG